MGRGRPGRSSSYSPDTPCARNRRRHRPTVTSLVSSCPAISRFVFPEAHNKIILARRTSPAGRERELAKPSSCSRSSASKTNAAFGRPIAIGTSIVHRRCLDSQQYYCQLFTGQHTRIDRPRTLPANQPLFISDSPFSCKTWRTLPRAETCANAFQNATRLRDANEMGGESVLQNGADGEKLSSFTQERQSAANDSQTSPPADFLKSSRSVSGSGGR